MPNPSMFELTDTMAVSRAKTFNKIMYGVQYDPIGIYGFHQKVKIMQCAIFKSISFLVQKIVGVKTIVQWKPSPCEPQRYSAKPRTQKVKPGTRPKFLPGMHPEDIPLIPNPNNQTKDVSRYAL